MKYPKIINGVRAGCTCYRGHRCQGDWDCKYQKREVIDVCGNAWVAFLHGECWIALQDYCGDDKSYCIPGWRWRMKEEKND